MTRRILSGSILAILVASTFLGPMGVEADFFSYSCAGGAGCAIDANGCTVDGNGCGCLRNGGSAEVVCSQRGTNQAQTPNVNLGGQSAQQNVNSAAQPTTFVPLAPTTGTALDAAYKTTNLGDYFNALFKIGLSIGAMAAVLRLVYAGYMYMGSDMWSSKGKAREIIRDTTLGILLLLAIWLILFQINPNILNLNILQNVSATSPTTTGTTPLDRAMQSINDSSYRTDSTNGSPPKLGCYSVSRDLPQCSAGYVKARGVQTDEDGVRSDGAYYYCCPQ